MCIGCALAGWPPSRRERGPFPEEADPFPWPDRRRDGGTLTWTGVAGFVFACEGTRIAFDPFVSRPLLSAVVLRAPAPDAARVERWFSDLDAVFVGHTHYDHAMDLAAVARASPRARIVGSATTVELCRRLGVADDRLAAASDGVTTTVGPFRVSAVAADHGKVPVARFFDRMTLPARGLPSTPARYPRGEVLAWRVEASGRTFHVHGSAGIDDAALGRQGPVDALIACLAARKGTPRYLERLVAPLKPSVLVPCHHDDFFRPLDEPPAPVPTLRWRAFRRESRALAERDGVTTWLPVRGEPAAW
jgi:L-ascorbate metabolism protein UlaG (beta-lactamase superfamily)